MKVLAFDVSSEHLQGYDGTTFLNVPNEPAAIGRLLKSYSSEWSLILEPTSIYHLELAERAHKAGLTVYLVNPRVASKFRQTRSRAKTDQVDAECLHAFCTRNHEDLRAWSPLPASLEKLRHAVKRHRKTVQTRVSLAQSLSRYPCKELDAALEKLGELEDRLQEDAAQAAKEVDEAFYTRLLEAPGFGPYSACAYTFLLCSRDFESPDAVRAFVGLDLRVSDSGKRKGRRCVSHLGDSTFRHAVCVSGRGLLNSRYGSQANVDLKAKGRHSSERMVIAARKQIRTAYAIFKSKEPFKPEKFTWSIDTKT